VEPLDLIELFLLQHHLAQAAGSLGPGARVPLGRLLRRCLGDLAGEIAERLRRRELCVGVDGHPAADPLRTVWVSRETRLTLYRQVGDAVEVVPTDAWLN